MAKNATSYQVFLSSRFDEFEALRKVITDRQTAVLTVVADIGNPADHAAQSTLPSGESVKQAGDADVVVLFIGETYGHAPPGFDKSHIHLEFEAAKPGRVLAYRVSSGDPSSHEEDPRLADLISQVEKCCTLTTLDLVDLNQAADHILIDLRNMLAEVENSAPQTPIAEARAAQLGRGIVRTPSIEWRNDQIGPLDRRVIGEPGERQATLEAVNLVGRTDDEWNESCKAFKLGSADLTIEHLERALELRPLDGEARYWLARLEFGAPDGTVKYEHVAENAAVAAASLLQQDRQGPAGLAHLVEAKALRASSDLENGLAAARRSAELLGGSHAEPNLELAYQSITAGDSAQAFTSIRKAFILSPPCLGPARKQFETLDGGPALLADFERKLAEEAEVQVIEMHEFGRALFAHAGTLAEATTQRRRSVNDDFALMDLEPRSIPGYYHPIPRETRECGIPEVVAPAEYRRAGAGDDPAAVVRDGVSKAADNLERLRDVEALLQRSAAIVRDARDLSAQVQLTNRKGASSHRWLWGVPVAGSLAIGLLTGSSLWTLLVGAVLIGLVALYVVVEGQKAAVRLRAAAQRVTTMEQAWLEEAAQFRDLVHEYERVHLIWPSYAPRSVLPDHIDREIGIQLFVRQYPLDGLGRAKADLDALAPDLRELADSIKGPHTLGNAMAMDPGFVLGDVPAATSPEMKSPPRSHLLGRVERRVKPAGVFPPARWKAYRRAATGPTLLDGSAVVPQPWIGLTAVPGGR